MNRDDIIRVLRRELTARGFVGRGRSLRVIRAEVAWFVGLEKIPRTARVGVDLGACPEVLAPGGWPTRANDCPIIFDPASGGVALIDHDSQEAWEALDEGSPLTDEARQRALLRLAGALADVADRVTLLDDLRAAAAAGRLTGFLRKDARALLESGLATGDGA